MKIKKWLLSVVVLAAASLGISCARTTEESVDEVQGVMEVPEVIAEEDEEPPKAKEGCYIFQDKDGNSYEAQLLENVPPCEYDYTKLKDNEGLKSYKDPENGICARVGLDISESEGEIDWQQVKEWGADFVIIRAGYRTYGEGGELVLDVGFEQNIQGAAEAGLDVGVYFFSQAISQAEAVEEAEFVLEQIENYDIKGPIVYKLEDIGEEDARTDGNTVEQYTDNCISFCETIEEAGYESMIYADMKWMAFALNLEKLSGYEFWYADYQDEPQCPYDFSMWQYTEIGVVPGIESNVNINLWFTEEE